MSTIKTNAILDASGGNTTTINGTTPTAYNTMGKNRIINGAMGISQRGTSFSSHTGGYTLDRFDVTNSNSGAITVNQSSESPDGFSNSLHIDVTTADTSVAAAEYCSIRYKFEGQDLQDLAYGSTSAKTITLSFWVKSTVTGDYTFELYQNDASPSRGYTAVYTVNSADTWEKKTITISGDTSGTINNDNGVGLSIHWNLMAGSDYQGNSSTDNTWSTYVQAGYANGQTANALSSTSNNFYITGVQLEVGSVATEFERRPYGTELQLCQRYFETSYPYGTSFGSFQPGFASGTTSGGATGQVNGNSFKVTKRAVPTITLYNAVAGTSGGVYRVSDAANVSTTASYIGTTAIGYLTLGASSENGYYWHFTANAEL